MKRQKQGKSAKNKKGRLTIGMRRALRREQRRTGLSAAALVRECTEHLDGIGPAKIASWLDGQAEKVVLAEYERVLALWRLLPEEDVFVKRSHTVLAQLRGERARTQVGIRKLFDGRTDIPDGLTSKLAWEFFGGTRLDIRKDYLDYIQRCWKELPTRHFVTIRQKMAATLKGHIERTGKKPSTILRGARDRPDGLDSVSIQKWLKPGRTVRRDHWDYILHLYETPDDRVLVPYPLRMKIKQHIRRTGVEPGALLRAEGLVAHDDPTDWSKWPPSRVSEPVLQLMLARWEALPDRRKTSGQPRPPKRFSHPPETPGEHAMVPYQLRTKIRRQIRRTGVGPDELLRVARRIAQDGSTDWRQWPPAYVAEVMLAEWEALPDRCPSPEPGTAEKEESGPLTAAQREALREQAVRKDISPPKTTTQDRARFRVVPLMPGERPRAYKKRLRSIELEHYARFQEQVQNILPLPGKKINELFRLLLRNGGRLSQAVRASQFAGLTEEEAAGIEHAYLRTF